MTRSVITSAPVWRLVLINHIKVAAKAAKAAQKAAEVKVSNKIKNAEVKYDTKKMGADTYIKTLQKIQKQNKLTSEQNRKIQREIYQASKTPLINRRSY